MASPYHPTRDPVSELFDRGARNLLDRAYKAKGAWAGTRLADPDPRHVAYFRSLGIDVTGPDNAPTRSGRRNNAHTRWGRGFVRAVYYQHRWYSELGAGSGWRPEKRMRPRTAGAIELEWGRRVPRTGVIPAGRAVRVRVRRGGQAKLRAVQDMPDAERTWTDDGQPGGRWSDPTRRDW